MNNAAYLSVVLDGFFKHYIAIFPRMHATLDVLIDNVENNKTHFVRTMSSTTEL